MGAGVSIWCSISAEYLTRRHRAARVEKQIAKLFAQSAVLNGAISVLDNVQLSVKMQQHYWIYTAIPVYYSSEVVYPLHAISFFPFTPEISTFVNCFIVICKDYQLSTFRGQRSLEFKFSKTSVRHQKAIWKTTILCTSKLNHYHKPKKVPCFESNCRNTYCPGNFTILVSQSTTVVAMNYWNIYYFSLFHLHHLEHFHLQKMTRNVIWY